jgi:hypothetical protein
MRLTRLGHIRSVVEYTLIHACSHPCEPLCVAHTGACGPNAVVAWCRVEHAHLLVAYAIAQRCVACCRRPRRGRMWAVPRTHGMVRSGTHGPSPISTGATSQSPPPPPARPSTHPLFPQHAREHTHTHTHAHNSNHVKHGRFLLRSGVSACHVSTASPSAACTPADVA